MQTTPQPGLPHAPTRTDAPGLLEAHHHLAHLLDQHDALPNHAPNRVTLHPKILPQRTHHRLSRTLHHLHQAQETLIDTLLETPDAFTRTIDPQTLRLARIDPGYDNAVQIARYDGLLHDDTLTILEFNTDSPGGAARADLLDESYQSTRRHHPDLDLPKPSRIDARLPELQRALLDAYAQWSHDNDHPRNPRIVLTDWANVASRSDIDLTLQHLQANGLNATFCDPREFELDGDTLTLQNEPVDLVYKRVILHELLDEPDAKDLITAYEEGAVCMVNAPRSILAGDKRALAELRDDHVQTLLTPEQRHAIDAHIPPTYILQDDRITHQGKHAYLRDIALTEKDRFVLKPATGYGGEGVHLGFQTPTEAWGTLIDTHISDASWVLQELVPIPQAPYWILEDEGITTRSMNETVNPFIIDGAFAGAYTRISKNARVNVTQGGAVCPTVLQ